MLLLFCFSLFHSSHKPECKLTNCQRLAVTGTGQVAAVIVIITNMWTGTRDLGGGTATTPGLSELPGTGY